MKLKILQAKDTDKRIKIIEDFMLDILKNKATIDNIVKSTIDALISTRGSTPISSILKDELYKRRQLERKFFKQVGMSPKQLGKVIRLQTALKMVLNHQSENLTKIAYESDYYARHILLKTLRNLQERHPKNF